MSINRAGRFTGKPCNLGDVMSNKPLIVHVKNGPLKVHSVDLLKSRTGQNRKEHHTDSYQSDNLVVRRGQSFEIEIKLSREFEPRTDQLQLLLNLGSVPLSRGTLVTVPIVNEFQGKLWEAKILQQDVNKINLSIISPPTALIGQYELTVKTGDDIFSPKDRNDIYLLFNPWCPDDAVFMDNEDERNEYVLNDMGRIYYGNENQIGGREWNFGQFNEGILEACLFILRKSQTPASGWGDPVNITRVVSAMINSNDDQGVLEGNWSGVYTNGMCPTVWSGSVEILRQYHRRGGVPVRYGQCWVFSGVTTSVLRCLGIPTRSVTNFSSAHDTDNSLSHDIFFDEKMKPIDCLNTDAVWNFHVWNDCWMARPDLPPGMGGWQAVDATPQETSQGTFCCGPAPLEAIREGLVYYKYDAPFIFAEVNSDKILWQRQPNGTFVPISCDKSVVGRNISTKAVGSERRQDITHLYKHDEGSEKERIAVETASKYGSRPNTYSCAVTKDVTLNVGLNGEEPQIGQDAQLSITLKNESSEKRTVSLYCQASVMYYTGVQKGTVKKEDLVVNLNPNQVQTLDWNLPYDRYMCQLVDQAALMLTVTGRVRETKQVLANMFNFRLRSPDIIINPVSEAVVGKDLLTKIMFRNPLQQVLKSVVFHIEGLGEGNEIFCGDIGSLKTISFMVNLLPTVPGMRKLLASLECPQLTQVHGATDIHVKEK